MNAGAIAEMAGRDDFLGRVRAEMRRAEYLVPAKASTRPSEPGRAAAAVRALARERTEELLARFRSEAERVSVGVHRVATMAEAGNLILGLAVAREVRRVATWSVGALGGAAAVAARLSDAGLEVLDGSPTEVSRGPRQWLHEAVASADMGLTGVDVAIAETGTLVLVSGPGKGRAVSLLPAYHVAVFGAGQLIPGLEEAGVLLESWQTGAGVDAGANVVFITGPSRTADIELTLTLGVHGPKEVHAVFVESA